MLYLLYGADSYRKNAFVRQLVGQRKERYPDIAVASFDCDDDDGLLHAYNFIAATNLFESGKKIGVCAHAASHIGDPLLRPLFIASQRNDQVIFLIEESDRSPVDVYGTLLDGVTYQQKEFPILTASSARVFACSYARQHGYSITDDGCRAVADLFKGDTWGMCTELDRLGAVGTTVDAAYVLANGTREEFGGGFLYARGMLDAENAAQRLWQLERALAQHIEPMFLLNVMAKSASGRASVVALAEADKEIKMGLLSPDQAVALFCCLP